MSLSCLNRIDPQESRQLASDTVERMCPLCSSRNVSYSKQEDEFFCFDCLSYYKVVYERASPGWDETAMA